LFHISRVIPGKAWSPNSELSGSEEQLLL